jgi:hypothetical protein
MLRKRRGLKCFLHASHWRPADVVGDWAGHREPDFPDILAILCRRSSLEPTSGSVPMLYYTSQRQGDTITLPNCLSGDAGAVPGPAGPGDHSGQQFGAANGTTL